MNKNAHQLFAIGLATVFAYLFDINLFILPFILILAFFIGSFPDKDLEWGIGHRGVTHSLLFFFLMALLCTFGVFYFYAILESAIGVPVFEAEVDENFIPIFFTKLSSLDMDVIFNDGFFKLFAFFFSSFFSHFILDIITLSGLDVTKEVHISGSIRSNNTFFNFFFGSVGLITFFISLIFIILREISGTIFEWSTWFYIIDGGLIVIIFIISIGMKFKKIKEDYTCFDYDKKVQLCIPKGTCIQLGSGKDDLICNEW